jgi:hypothetical protein
LLIEQHKPKGKTIPILSGEWGYSSAWGGISPEIQGKYLSREFLFNLSQDIPLSIWYDWHDDGPDPKEPEHHFGTILYDARQPKPAYRAAKTLTSQLAGFSFNKRIALEDPNDYFLLFTKGDEVRAVAWTTAPDPRKVILPASPGAFSIVESADDIAPKELVADEHGLAITVTGSPQYLVPDAPNDLLRIAAAWERLPPEMVIQWPAHALVRPTLTNPLDREITVIRQNRSRDTVAPQRILRDAIMFDTLRQPGISVRRVQYHIDGVGDIAQTIDVIVSNPLIVTPLAPAGDSQPVRIDNPSGEAADLIAKRTGDKTARTSLSFATNETTKLVELGGDASAGIEIWSADGGQLEATARACRFVPISLDPKRFEIHAEGDASVKSTQSFSQSEAPRDVPVKMDHLFTVSYDFAAGWKYACLEPRGKSGQMDGKPLALTCWLKGDGSGNIARVRFVDFTGQTFQPDGNRLDFTGWRYLSYPLNATASHWGGANDGVIHYPMRLQTMLLIDSGARQATKGQVSIASPAVVYGE